MTDPIKTVVDKLVEKHYDAYKSEVECMHNVSELDIADEIFKICDSIFNEDDSFDAMRDTMEAMECKYVLEMANNLSYFNTPEFLQKYETRVIADMRVENVITSFRRMSLRQFTEWKAAIDPQ